MTAPMERSDSGRIVRLAAIAAAALALSACANKQLDQSANAGGLGPNGQYGYGAGGPVVPGTEREFEVRVGDKVYFTTDSVQLTQEAQQTLRGQARWLNQYPKYTITIEGHADERGTREYNLALGARRAAAVRAYLTQLGVNPRRLRTVSFGKERPVEVCNDISCWSKNRRAHTKLNRRGTS